MVELAKVATTRCVRVPVVSKVPGVSMVSAEYTTISFFQHKNVSHLMECLNLLLLKLV